MRGDSLASDGRRRGASLEINWDACLKLLRNRLEAGPQFCRPTLEANRHLRGITALSCGLHDP